MTGPLLWAVVTGGWVAGWWLLWRLPGLEPASGITGHDDLAVIIPARNEAYTLPVLLADLAAQQRPPAELVVVDDGSDDDTAALAAAAGAGVVRTDGPPAGWTGKAWACWVGVESTTAPVMVFLDADVRLGPHALARLATTHERTGGLLSVEPHHVTGRPIEALSMGANVVTLAGSGAFTPRPTDSNLAFGPCLVCLRRQYLAIGGHAAVRGAVAEDAALAARFRHARLPVRLRAGRDAVAFRMYPGGLPALAEGWTKNLAVGAGTAPRLAAVLAALWVAGALGSVGLVAGMASAAPLVAAGVYAAMVAQVAWMVRRIGRFGWWPIVLYPVPVAAFVVLFGWSFVCTHVIGSVVWRGRRIAVGRQRA